MLTFPSAPTASSPLAPRRPTSARSERAASTLGLQQPLLTPPPSPPHDSPFHLSASSAGGPFRPTLRRSTTTDSARPVASGSGLPSPAPTRPLSHTGQSMPRLPPLPGLGSPLDMDAQSVFADRPRSLVRASTPKPVAGGLPTPPAAADYAFLSAPPPARSSRRTSDNGDEPPSRRNSNLTAGSARSNYFNLDFSFLDEAPPPVPQRSGASLFGSKKKAPAAPPPPAPASPHSTHSRLRDSVMSTDSFDLNGRTPSVRSVSAPTAMPFPSRPKSIRRKSNDSTASSIAPAKPPFNPQPSLQPAKRNSLMAPGAHGENRRPSMASSFSVESNSSTAGRSNGRGSPTLGFYVRPRADEDEDGEEAQARRKRLAEFLHETAAAMEGGKSLAMVLPEAAKSIDAAKPGMSLSELAEATSPKVSEFRPVNWGQAEPDQAQNRSLGSVMSAASSGEDPTTPNANGQARPRGGAVRQSVHVYNRRSTVYFTPDPNETSPRSGANAAPIEEEDDEDEAEHLHASAGAGLGLDVELAMARSAPDRSPSSTLRGHSPGPADAEAAVDAEAEKKAKAADKRRRIMDELIETETTYAIDMVVVRDIYLARARGADMAAIADHVMSTGLGLGGALNSPESPALSNPGTFYSAGSPTAGSRFDLRRPSLFPGAASDARRPSSLTQRRPTLMPSQPILLPGQPLMSSKDIKTVFANLEEIAGLAEAFVGVLDGARGSGLDGSQDDIIGQVFVEIIPRIQQVYSDYCVQHHRAIVKLQELEPAIKSYLSECKTLSHGRTNAWDLASLLIKPVQRCLKYPLLLDQILAVTPADHPDRPALQRALQDMLQVAEHINEVKKRHDVVNKVIGKKDLNIRRGSTVTQAVTKKLLRSGQKAKIAIGLGGDAEGNSDMFDTLTALVDSTKSGVLRFSSEMRDWTKTTKAALESQVTMVEAWIDLYAPKNGDKPIESGSHERLCYFLEDVLMPVIDGPWRTLDHQVRRELITKTDHLLSLFENPVSIITKRNDKMLDHQRYMAKKLPADKKGSDDFLTLSAQLQEELPRFLGSVSRYFNIIVGHFATAQANYHEAVQESWTAFAEAWMNRAPEGIDVERQHAEQHQPVAQMMETLAVGLGIVTAQPASPRVRSSIHRKPDAASPRPASRPASQAAQPEERRTSLGLTGYTMAPKAQYENRSSVTSDSSTPSFTVSSAGGSSSGAPTTPPMAASGFTRSKRDSEYRRSDQSLGSPRYDQRALAAKYEQPLPSVPTHADDYSSDGSTAGDKQASSVVTFHDSPHFDQLPRARPVPGRQSREQIMSTYSVYVPAEEDFTEDDGGVLYMAEAMTESRSTAFRSGYPVLSFKVGDRIAVELEEADSAEGGCGWLLGRKDDGTLGWARTEDMAMLEEDEDED